jgi:hypothetical protein
MRSTPHTELLARAGDAIDGQQRENLAVSEARQARAFKLRPAPAEPAFAPYRTGAYDGRERIRQTR